MKYGVRNSLASVVVGLALGAAALLTPQAALSKNPKPVPTPAAVNDFQKEKNKIENSGIERSSISKSGPASYSIPGLSVEPATTSALVRRLENAQVIIQAIDHTFDAGRDKHTALLRQLRIPLNIGAVLIEEFPSAGQDSLTAFCTTGKPNMLTEAVAYSSYYRGPYTQYALMWLLAEARALDIELIALGPDWSQSKYEFLQHSIRDNLCRYVELANQDMLSTILEQLSLHPGQRIVVQVGSAHVPRLQALLSDAGISSSSLQIWKPGMAVGQQKKHSANWITKLLNQADAMCAKYLPRLRSVGGDAIVDNVSPTSNFVLYSPGPAFSDMDYWRLMPSYFEREIRKYEREIRDLESAMGREWMVKQGLLSPDGSAVQSIFGH